VTTDKEFSDITATYLFGLVVRDFDLDLLALFWRQMQNHHVHINCKTHFENVLHDLDL